jgi:uncharacterized protein DUF4252
MKYIRTYLMISAFAVLAGADALAQDIQKLIDWDKLAPKAVETVDVTLDSNMLGMAARFLSGEKADEVKVKKLIGNLKGVYVRSMTFGKAGEYSLASVDAVRSQLKAPEWSKVVDVHSKDENTGIFMKTDGKQVLGLVVLAAEPKELTLVNIVGAIDPEDLKDLGGKFGIPNMEFGPKPKKK